MLDIAKDACEQTHYQDADSLDAYAACLARLGIFDEATTTAAQAVTQANAAHNPTLAKAIQKRLARYQQNLSYVQGDDLGISSTTQKTAP